MPSDEFILETHGLTKEFAGFVAVSDVNLRVRRGTIHALIGPNGAGKTTSFNLPTKFLKPSRGQILYKGQDITATSPAVARLGLVVGAFVIIAMQQYLAGFGQWVTVIEGAIFVTCVMTFRRGIIGEIEHHLK